MAVMIKIMFNYRPNNHDTATQPSEKVVEIRAPANLTKI